ncbi:hypothetical protein [Rubripirellula lacrimiformis]
MNEPSSRTPEGVPHKCEICGTTFQLSPAVVGDVCCPNCNGLAWPVGNEELDTEPHASDLASSCVKEIRLRPATIDTDFDQKAKRAISHFRKRRDVRVSALFRSRHPEAQSQATALLERFVNSLVPKHATIKSSAQIDGRRIRCTLTSALPQDGE